MTTKRKTKAQPIDKADDIATWQQRMPAVRFKKQCDMNCSPRNPVGCDDCYTVEVKGDPIKARDEEIAALRARLGGER